MVAEGQQEREIIYLIEVFFSVASKRKLPLRSRVIMGDARQGVQFWRATGAAAAAIWKEISSLQQEMRDRVGNEAPKCPAVSPLLNTLACE